MHDTTKKTTEGGSERAVGSETELLKHNTRETTRDKNLTYYYWRIRNLEGLRSRVWLCRMMTTKVNVFWRNNNLFDVLVQRRWPCLMGPCLWPNVFFHPFHWLDTRKSPPSLVRSRKLPQSSLTSDSFLLSLFIYFPQNNLSFFGIFLLRKLWIFF
jgi:hypothetical protein